MTEYRAGLPERPRRIAALKLNEKGYPIPFFVAYVDGKPDFRVADPEKWVRCVRSHLCWICGEPLGRNLTFVAGPMCMINRVSSEPPMHYECAVYSATACPFLTLPHAKRREANLPEGVRNDEGTHNVIGGEMLTRNPGVTMLWNTRTYKLRQVENGYLFQIGEPQSIDWFAQGRIATRIEVEESINSGLPLLRERAEEGGPDDVKMLERMHALSLKYLPKE